MKESNVTFSFGKNWRNYIKKIGINGLHSAKTQIEDWVSGSAGIDLTKSSVIDVGCGSGLMSLAFHLLDSNEVTSFDYDMHSVATTKRLFEKAGSPVNWKVFHGDILSADYSRSLGVFDVVYSWGVLHHTGDMWLAVKNAMSLVKSGGVFYFSLYTAGPAYPQHLELKRKYNAASWLIKKKIEWFFIRRLMRVAWRKDGNPFKWNKIKEDERGMSVYYDLIDWLGGLPYEVASPDDVDRILSEAGFRRIRLFERGEGGCTEYLYAKC